VVIDAEHLCMSMRDVGTPQTRTTTRVFRGVFTPEDLG
jgi:GTP cyclohydrolase I